MRIEIPNINPSIYRNLVCDKATEEERFHYHQCGRKPENITPNVTTNKSWTIYENITFS